MIPVSISKAQLQRVAVVMTGLWLLSGCDEKYPADLKYPLRDDPIIKGTLDTKPTSFDRPGQLFHLLNDMIPEAAERDKLLLYPAQIPGPQQTELMAALERHFGTPLHPKVFEIDSEAGKTLKLDVPTLEKGSELYRLHCLHCHGLTGNGRGPTAPWVNPHPRDYRKGVFKFTSSSLDAGNRKARREDLYRTIREGLNGTTMPAHNTLPDEELEALVSYVIHLSIRGEMEELTMRQIAGGDSDVEGFLSSSLEVIVGRWVDTENSLIKPEGTYPDAKEAKASIANGYRLFTAPSELGGAGCLGCHEDYGRKLRYLNDVWGTIVRPANVTKGVYRGGRRPLDLYWRIHAGINGANMPASFETNLKPNDLWLGLLDENKKLAGVDLQRREAIAKEVDRLKLPEADMSALKQGKLAGERKEALRAQLASQRTWDLVNFLLNLPYPEMRKQNHIDIHAGGAAE